MVDLEVSCPCGSGNKFGDCCALYINGIPAPDAQTLMRSRYTAYVVGALDHVAATHAPEVRDDFNRAEAERLARVCQFQELDIRKVIEKGDSAQIDFLIRFRRDNKDMMQVELADFRREHGRWLYAGGNVSSQVAQRTVTRVGRNDPCPCGSGKKAKRCCGTELDEA